MKNTLIKYSLFVCAAAAMVSCSDIKRKPNRVYMPDMAYSRAVETYSDHSYLNAEGIQYNARPVEGTVKRGEVYYEILKDTTGSYNLSATDVNPLPALDSVEATEAARLYLINCGICHGTKLDGNGPLFNGGNGPYPAAPKNLTAPDSKAFTDGHFYYVITFGKGVMGSYASQLSTTQRWMVIHYIKSKQGAAKTAAPAAKADSVTAK